MVGDVKPDCKEMWNLTTVGDMPTPRRDMSNEIDTDLLLINNNNQ